MLQGILTQKIVESLTMPVPAFTRRDVFVPQIRARKAYAVIGMRRSGKTTYLWQVIADALASGAPRESLVYIDFEDDRLLPMDASGLDALVEAYYRLYPQYRASQRVLFCFDEIQAVSGWERFVRRLMDTELVDIYLSGSSARLLSREIATSMRGRVLEIRLFPFSFREFLRHLGTEPSQEWERLTPAERSQIEHWLLRYLSEGGFPEAIGADQRSRRELLRTYVDTAILRDVIERHQVSHPQALRWLVRQLLGNPASPFSAHKFYNDLRTQGFSIGKERVYEYITYLEDAFLIRTLALATFSERKRMTNPRKVYPIDMGLIPFYARTSQPSVGPALETAIYLELERRGAEVGYVRTPSGYEVDFLAVFPDGSTELIQVCADLGDDSVRQRELRALLEAGQEFPHARKRLITLTPPQEVVEGIEWTLASEWLLATPPPA
ncbi:MAG: ATP-binding protein [Armatimonadetes bacterium]|nr:ATP-binding protein [Armatimonadota bacterium]